MRAFVWEMGGRRMTQTKKTISGTIDLGLGASVRDGRDEEYHTH
jgi:hypothetical protein